VSEAADPQEDLPVALGAPMGEWFRVHLSEIGLDHPLPGDVFEVVDGAGRRGVARIICINHIGRTAHVVPFFYQTEGT
jgi:hypothetical protein